MRAVDRAALGACGPVKSADRPCGLRTIGPVRRIAALAAFVLLAAPGPRATAAPTSDPRDALLLARAERVGRNVATRHLTPEGLLAYAHRHGATGAQLSHDALKMADTGIWSGCYAASLACRYAVTRDPEALALCRRAAAGLDLLSTATGVEGAISRAAGRPIPGDPLPDEVKPSPLGGGLAYRDDPSRDTLSGVVLGWTCLARFVDDPEVRAYAGRNLGAIARRLFRGGMAVRGPDGRTTKHGSLQRKIALVFDNGSHASIGAAAVLAGMRWSGDRDLADAWSRLCDDGWDDAVDAQHTWVGGKALSASNVNMAHLALLVLALEDTGKAKRNALEAMREFRRATRGWHNGGLLACALLAGVAVDRDAMVEELRETLLDLPAGEVPWVGGQPVERGMPVPLERRPVSVWTWKQDPDRELVAAPDMRLDPERTFTRADYLFAYWLARAAGELAPDGPRPASVPPPPPR